MKVLVLGCGEMGEAAVQDLYFHGGYNEIIIGTRSLKKVKKVLPKLKGRKAKVSPKEIDIRNKKKLEALMKGCDVVVNCVGHPEPITLARSFKEAKIIDDKATFYPPFVNDLIIDLGKMVRDAVGPIQVGNVNIDAMDFAASYFHKKCKSLEGFSKEGALRVAVKGKLSGKTKKVIYSSSGMLSEGTGIAASIGAQMLSQGKIKSKGVMPPEECVDWREFLRIIISRRIGRLNIKEE